MTGPENKVKAGSLGNIKDLLKKANESDDSSSWRERLRGRVGGENPPTQDNTTSNAKEKADNVEYDTKKAVRESAKVERSNQQKDEEETEQQPKTTATPKPSKCLADKPKPNQVQPTHQAKHTKANGTYKAFETQVDKFEQKASKGKRHMIFVTDKVFNTLSVVYGEKNMSAVINALAENHIDKYKEEMKQSFRNKSPLFSE